MDVIIYYADGDVETCTTPYPRNTGFDRWVVGIRQRAEDDAWCVRVRPVGADADAGAADLLVAEDGGYGREGYEDMLDREVLAITVDGYPFWPRPGQGGRSEADLP